MNIADIDAEIARLESQLSALHQSRVQLLENEIKTSQERASALGGGGASTATISRSPATGKKKAASKKKKAASKKKRGGRRRRRMSSDEVRNRLLDTVKAAGKDGIALKDISEQSGVNYQTAAKVLKEMNEITKKGKLKSARYHAK